MLAGNNIQRTLSYRTWEKNEYNFLDTFIEQLEALTDAYSNNGPLILLGDFNWKIEDPRCSVNYDKRSFMWHTTCLKCKLFFKNHKAPNTALYCTTINFRRLENLLPEYSKCSRNYSLVVFLSDITLRTDLYLEELVSVDRFRCRIAHGSSQKKLPKTYVLSQIWRDPFAMSEMWTIFSDIFEHILCSCEKKIRNVWEQLWEDLISIDRTYFCVHLENVTKLFTATVLAYDTDYELDNTNLPPFCKNLH